VDTQNVGIANPQKNSGQNPQTTKQRGVAGEIDIESRTLKWKHVEEEAEGKRGKEILRVQHRIKDRTETYGLRIAKGSLH
jgi:hypothetical protein